MTQQHKLCVALITTLGWLIQEPSLANINATAPHIAPEQYKKKSSSHLETPLLESKPSQSFSVESDLSNRSLSPSDLNILEDLIKKVAVAEKNKQSSIAPTPKEAEALWVMGLLYLHGIGVTPQLRRSQQLFELAWFGKERKAALGLAWCAIDGCGSVGNQSLSTLWLTEVAQLDQGRASYLEWYRLNQLAPISQSSASEPDKEPVSFNHHDLLNKAMKTGDTQAQIEFGIEAASRNDLKTALQYFQLAANRSLTAKRNAELIKEQMSLNSLAQAKTNKNSSQSELLLKRAIQFHRGDGVPSDYYQAIQLYKESAQLGNERARRILKLIFSKPGGDNTIDIAWMRQLSQTDILTGKSDSHPLIGPKLLLRDPTPISDYLPLNFQKYLNYP